MSVRAIGASYLFRQSPGSERVGGLQITLHPPSESAGRIIVDLSEKGTKAPLKGQEWMAEAALQGVQELASEHQIDLSRFDVVLSEFMWHPVDSHSKCYHQAGRSAMRSALEAWRLRDLERL